MSTSARPAGNVEDTVKHFLANRPVRVRQGRVVAGVAAGIGKRYAVDPVLIRVALVVSTFYGGAGLIAYLLGWLLLAEEGAQVSPLEGLLHRGNSNTSRALTIVLCACLIPAAFFVFGGYFATLAGGLMLVGGLFWLHLNRGGITAASAPPASPVEPVDPVSPVDPEVGAMTDSTPTGVTPPAAPAGQPEDAVPASPTVGYTIDGHPEDQPRSTPPAWDPLGAAPFAWDLPEPAPVEPEPRPAPPRRRRRPRIALFTVGAALVTAAGMWVAMPYADWLDSTHVVGVVTAVVGLGLVVSAFTRGGRGLIPLAAVLCIASVASVHSHIGFGASPSPNDTNFYQPVTTDDVQSVYSSDFGDIVLDLTKLPKTGTVNTSVRQSTGDVTVRLPVWAKATVTCSSDTGDVRCLSQHTTGPGAAPLTSSQPGSPNDPNPLTITLDVTDGTGNIRVVTSD